MHLTVASCIIIRVMIINQMLVIFVRVQLLKPFLKIDADLTLREVQDRQHLDHPHIRKVYLENLLGAFYYFDTVQ